MVGPVNHPQKSTTLQRWSQAPLNELQIGTLMREKIEANVTSQIRSYRRESTLTDGLICTAKISARGEQKAVKARRWNEAKTAQGLGFSCNATFSRGT